MATTKKTTRKKTARKKTVTKAPMPAEVTVTPAPLDVTPSLTPLQLLNKALEQNMDPAALEKLMDLQERWEKDQAKKAYLQAMTLFKRQAPRILKRRHVSYGDTEYWHATLEDIAEEIRKVMGPLGLDFHWETKQEDHTIWVTCVLSHVQGYTDDSTRLCGAPDTSGGKNKIQAVGSTVTYLQRYTLLAATGLASENMTGPDDDGRGGALQYETIDDKQLADLEALIDEVGANREAFIRYMNIPEANLANLPKTKMSTAVSALKQRGRMQ